MIRTRSTKGQRSGGGVNPSCHQTSGDDIWRRKIYSLTFNEYDRVVQHFAVFDKEVVEVSNPIYETKFISVRNRRGTVPVLQRSLLIQSGSVIAKWKCVIVKEEVKAGWKIVGIWNVWRKVKCLLWKKRSEVKELLFHWLYNRPARMFSDRKPKASDSISDFIISKK